MNTAGERTVKSAKMSNIQNCIEKSGDITYNIIIKYTH